MVSDQRFFYCRDEIYGTKLGYHLPKIRKRTIVSPKGIEVIYERTKLLKTKNDFNLSREKEIKKIPIGYKCESSYDKVRFYFKRPKYKICVDIYAFGIFCEIEGEIRTIRKVARQLGFDPKKSLKDNIDKLYCLWAKKIKEKNVFIGALEKYRIIF